MVGTKYYLAMPQILRAITGQDTPESKLRTSASKQFKRMLKDKLITWQGEDAPSQGVSILVERGAAKSGTCRLMVAEPQHWAKACMQLGRKFGRTYPLAMQVAPQLTRLAAELPHLTYDTASPAAHQGVEGVGGDLGGGEGSYDEDLGLDGWEVQEEGEPETESDGSGGLSESDGSGWEDADRGPATNDRVAEDANPFRRSLSDIIDLGADVRELAGTVARAAQEAVALCKLLQDERELAKPRMQATAMHKVPESYYIKGLQLPESVNNITISLHLHGYKADDQVLDYEDEDESDGLRPLPSELWDDVLCSQDYEDVHKYCTEMLVTDRGAERVRPATWEVKTRVALKSYLNLVFSKGLASDKEIGIECILNAEWLVQWLQWMLSGEAQLAKRTVLSYWNEARRLVEALGTINGLDTALLIRHMSNTYRQINHHVKEKLNEAEPSEMEGALRALYKVARQHRDQATRLLDELGDGHEGAEEDAKLEAARALESAVLALSTCALVHPPLRPSYLETTYIRAKPGRCKDPTCSQQGTCPGNVFTTKTSPDASEGDYGEMGLVIRHHKGNTSHARPKPYEYNLSVDKAGARIYDAWVTWGHGVLQGERLAKSTKEELKPTPKFFTHSCGRPFTGDATAEKWRKALGLHGITINGRPINLRDVRSLFVCGLALKHASQNTYIQDDELDTLAAGMGSSPTMLLNEYNKLYSLERERSGVRAAQKAGTLAAHYVEGEAQEAGGDGDAHGLTAALPHQATSRGQPVAAGQEEDRPGRVAWAAAGLPSPPPTHPQATAAAAVQPPPQRPALQPTVRGSERAAVHPWGAADPPSPSLPRAELAAAVGPQLRRPEARVPGRPWGPADWPPVMPHQLKAAFQSPPHRQEATQVRQLATGGGERVERHLEAVLHPAPSSVPPLQQQHARGWEREAARQLGTTGAGALGARHAALAVGAPLPYLPLSHTKQHAVPRAPVEGGKKRPSDTQLEEPSRRMQARLDEIDRQFRKYYGHNA